MPITRYQIRNEYSLADPELYLAANKDDPEALLEGVAMAGLVGVLRQLGDLSEFAAKIFHSLHEEVMVTAARGHNLTARVQQLEAEVPLIEKAILSQTNHSSSFQIAGVEWHPNLRMSQNMITQGDLPRFVMDSYEECRGPPRLFILDKFDIAGAGACLKRYTNPSFFKVEPASSGAPNVDSRRDRRIRKVKKKGARGRNSETPEILPNSNVKLHRLFLEDRFENGDSEPARLVKLKKRHLQESPFDSHTGNSYLQKLFHTSPEHKFVRDIAIVPLPPSDSLISNSIENGHKILDIQTVTYATESLENIRDRYVTPSPQETVQISSMDEMSEDASVGENLHMAALGRDHEMDRMMSMLYNSSDEKELDVDRESVPESSVSESEIDVPSVSDNYMDALNSLESEIEMDTESRHKNNLSLFNGYKHGTDSDAKEEQNKNRSENGVLPFEKKTASSSYSDLSGLIGDESAEAAAVESSDTSYANMRVGHEVSGTISHQHSLVNNGCSEVAEVQAEHNKPPLDPAQPSNVVSSVVSKRSLDADKLGNGLLYTDVNRKSTKEIVPAVKTVDTVSSRTTVLTSESHHTKLDDSGPNASTDTLLHVPSTSDLNQEKNSRPNGINSVMHADDNSCRRSLSHSSMHLISDSEQDVKDNCRENVGLYYRPMVSPSEEKILSSNIPDALQGDVLHSSTARNLVESTPVVNDSLSNSFDQKTSQRARNFHEHNNYRAEFGVLHFEETTDTDGAYGTKDLEEISESRSNGDKIDSSIAPSIFSSISPGNETHEDPASKQHTVTRTLQAKAEDRMIGHSAAVSNENGSESSHLLLNIPCSSSRSALQESLSSSADSRQNIVEVHSSSPLKCHIEADVPGNVTQFVACSSPTQYERHQNITPFHDCSTSEVASIQIEKETELDSHHQTHILDISKSFGSVRTRHTSDPGYHTKQVVEGQAEQLDPGTPNFSFRHYEQLPGQDDMAQDRCTSTTRGSFLEDLPGQASTSCFSLQSTSINLESSEKTMSTSLPFFPKHSLLPVASEVSKVEPLELSPLPPMQWREGKLPSSMPPPTENEDDQSDTILSTESEQPHNPSLPLSGIISEPPYVIEHFAGPGPLLLSIPTMISSSEENQDSSNLGDSKNSPNPFLFPPPSPKRPRETSLDVEGERTNHISNVLPLETPVEVSNTAEDKELEHLNFQNSREKVSNLMLLHPLPLVENPQPQLGLQGPGEGNPNEDSIVKVPRPRNPLIDAVAAHGKNTLRKVAERARPPIEKEVEERDTILEQIRNKTFNLKPAVSVRPRIQVPQTNLKMAAILEKANKIRMATVGSDEDDDDNWSDD